MPTKTATYAIDLEGNAASVSKEMAAQLEELRTSVEKGQVSVKNMTAVMRSLKGASQEVKDKKAELAAQIDAVRGKVSRNNLELLKLGTTYEALAQKARKKAAADAAMGQQIKKVGGPISELEGKLETLKGVFTTTGGAIAGVGVAVTGVAAAWATLAAAEIKAGIELTKWTLQSANALRAMGLMREAASGSAENAKNLGEQVDFLSTKLSTPKEKLNEVATSLTKALSGGTSRASGQAIVDTFEAVSRAADAMGDDVGSQIGEIVKRSKTFGRLRIDPFELQGTGLHFEDIAAQLAKNTKIGVDKAKAALFEGRVGIDEGAKALRDAIEKRFGEVNAKKLLDLNVISDKLHEKWVNLTKGVNLEPILASLSKLTDLFDEGTVSGEALKEIFGGIGDIIGTSTKEAVPIFQDFIEKAEIGALDLEISFFKAKKAFDVKGPLNDAKEILLDVGKAAEVVAKSILAVAHAWGAWDRLKRAASGDVPVFNAKGEQVEDKSKTTMGPEMSAEAYQKQAFARSIGGHAKGGEIAKPAPGEIFVSATPGETIVPAGMALVPRGGGAGGSSGGTTIGSITVEVHYNPPAGAAGGAEGGQLARKELSEPAFLAQLTKAVRDALVGAGVPTQEAQ